MTRIDISSATTEELFLILNTRVDFGCASTEQLALIVDTRRAESDEDAASSDVEILAHVRDTLTLPGEGAPGGFPVTDDGTAYAAALIAFLTPAGKKRAGWIIEIARTPDERAASTEINRRSNEAWEALSPAERAAQIEAIEWAENGGPCDCPNCYEPPDY